MTSRDLGVPRLICQIGVPLAEQSALGHNRWHPDIPPAIEIDPGGEVILEAPGYDDYQVHDDDDPAELHHVDFTRMHPLAGPVHVHGAKPGDLLDIEILGVEPLSGVAFSNILPGTAGILADEFPTGWKSVWYARGSIAESRHVPGVRIPAQPHPGVVGVAPSHELLERWNAREAPLAENGQAFAPEPRNARLRGLPPEAATTAARTTPPRENGGNVDVKHLGPGSHLYLPVFVEGGLVSVGDHHLAAGDGECSWNAMEMDGVSWLRINVIEDGVARYGVKTPILRPAPIEPRFGADRYLAFTGFSFTEEEQRFQDTTLAAREAMLRAVDYLTRFDFTAEQAYTILSVAPVDYRISVIVDIPNPCVTLHLPIDIFDRDVLPRSSRNGLRQR
jgi:formamidase